MQPSSKYYLISAYPRVPEHYPCNAQSNSTSSVVTQGYWYITRATSNQILCHQWLPKGTRTPPMQPSTKYYPISGYPRVSIPYLCNPQPNTIWSVKRKTGDLIQYLWRWSYPGCSYGDQGKHLSVVVQIRWEISSWIGPKFPRWFGRNWPNICPDSQAIRTPPMELFAAKWVSFFAIAAGYLTISCRRFLDLNELTSSAEEEICLLYFSSKSTRMLRPGNNFLWSETIPDFKMIRMLKIYLQWTNFCYKILQIWDVSSPSIAEKSLDLFLPWANEVARR